MKKIENRALFGHFATDFRIAVAITLTVLTRKIRKKKNFRFLFVGVSLAPDAGTREAAKNRRNSKHEM